MLDYHLDAANYVTIVVCRDHRRGALRGEVPSMHGPLSAPVINRRKAVAFGLVTRRGESRSAGRKGEKQQAIPARRVCWPVIRVLQRRYLATLLTEVAVNLVAEHFEGRAQPIIVGLRAILIHVISQPGLLIGG